MIIFSPGPANISERVRNTLTLPDISHRGKEFNLLLKEVKGLIVQIMKIDNRSFEIVFFGGSGTLAIESLLSCLTGWRKRVLIISNGVYGERAAEIARVYGMEIREMMLEWGNLPVLGEVEKEIKKSEIGGVYLVHHETTTGLLNPLEDIAVLAKKYSKLCLVDAISSIGGEPIDFKWGLDAVLGTANKCFRGIPGIAFAIVNRNFLDIAKSQERRTYYSDLLTHLEKEKKGETPFTPPVQALFAFREALREISDEGIENRISHYRNISRILRGGLKKLGFRFFLPEELYSNNMISVYLPSKFSYKELFDLLKKKGFIIYNSQGSLQGKIFRLGLVGTISEQDIKNFLIALGEIVNAKKRRRRKND